MSDKQSRLLNPTKGFKRVYNDGEHVRAGYIDEYPIEWHPGVVQSSNVVKKSKYDDVRTYHIKFEDGDEIKDLAEEFVWSDQEYELEIDDSFKKKMKGKGITHHIIKGDDKYAEIKGVYTIKKYFGRKIYGSIVDVVRAHDNAYVKKHTPTKIKEKDLLLSDEWSFLPHRVVRKNPDVFLFELKTILDEHVNDIEEKMKDRKRIFEEHDKRDQIHLQNLRKKIKKIETEVERYKKIPNQGE